jgi:crotonobetainyl-CoA:carnitine CoA-transferase CaiB-like acyl-CoA transferase
MHGLRDLRVLDLSTGIAGAYATKLLADAGADVVKVEPREGDPLRRWTATGADPGPEDGALFRFLHHGKRGVVGAPLDPEVLALAAGAELVVESFAPHAFDAGAFRARFPSQVLLSITPFGRRGPFTGRPAAELTLQAESGSIATRGLRGREPFQAGGRIGAWVGGTFAAVAALAAVRAARASGRGEHVDFSLLECLHVAASNYLAVFHALLGRPPVRGLPQTVETPSIEPTADGWVGFCTNSAQQLADFLLLIERPDLRDDAALAQGMGRLARFDEWQALVHAWTRRHTTAEVVERASLLRIPVSPVHDARGVLAHEHLRARGVFVRDPTGSFEMPRPPWTLDGETPPGFTPGPRPAPRLGEHAGTVAWAPRAPVPDAPGPHAADSRAAGPTRSCAPAPRATVAGSASAAAPGTADATGPTLPLDGVRILDLTAWWAGPSATQMLATLGADVIHVESTKRPDGMRMMAGAFRDRPRWWEWSPFFLAANSNKRGLALDLADPRGRALALRLVARVDAVVENFTPRVLAQWGLEWPAIQAANPRAILVRMPAFGLDGPWRDHTGFAQTMEQMTGMAWITGHADDQPRIQRGPCDPLAGMHAAFALLVALAERERSGRGHPVECTMVEGALNAAAEQIVEWSAYGRALAREGNRSPEAAPQGLYACAGSRPGEEHWLALAVASDAQWRALVALLGHPAWALDPAFDTHAGRRGGHDRLDASLRPWFAAREREATVEALVAAGIPAGVVRDPREATDHPQLAARGFYEEVDHPVVGRRPLPGPPFRQTHPTRWIRRPPPTLGQHSREILRELADVTDAELDALEAAGVIGEAPP